MLKKSVLGFAGLLLSAFAWGQGINFQHGTWAEAKALAAKENKFIFVDAYAEWCGPCKWLSAEIFPQEPVGEFFNKNYISFKIDAEKGEGVDFAKEFGIAAYPTLFYFNPKGELVHRTVGALDADKLVAAGGDALDPEKQLYTLKKRYEGGERGTDFLLNCAKAFFSGAETEMGGIASEEYFKLLPKDKWISADNFDLILNSPAEPDSEMFKYVLENRKAWETALGDDKDKVGQYVDYVLLMPIYQAMFSQDKKVFEEAKAVINKTVSGDDAKRLNAKADYYFYMQQGISNKTIKYIAPYFDNYCNDLYEFNEVSWAVYEASNAKSILTKALSWINKSVAIEEVYYNTDTKAALLYKLKKYTEAAEWAEKAIALGEASEMDVTGTKQLLEEINKHK